MCKHESPITNCKCTNLAIFLLAMSPLHIWHRRPSGIAWLPSHGLPGIPPVKYDVRKRPRGREGVERGGEKESNSMMKEKNTGQGRQQLATQQGSTSENISSVCCHESVAHKPQRWSAEQSSCQIKAVFKYSTQDRPPPIITQNSTSLHVMKADITRCGTRGLGHGGKGGHACLQHAKRWSECVMTYPQTKQGSAFVSCTKKKKRYLGMISKRIAGTGTVGTHRVAQKEGGGKGGHNCCVSIFVSSPFRNSGSRPL